jgi:hypothetical protein
VALADDLQERERQAGNTSDNLDPAQQHYDEQFDKIAQAEEDRDFDDIIADNYGDDASDEKVDAHGDTIQRNYNADEPEDSREDLENREQNPDSLYKSGADATSGLRGGIASWLARNGRRYGASGGVLGILGVGMIVISVTLSPAALFATIEKSLTNDGSDFSRTNSTAWKAYRGSLFKSECTGSKLKCKLTTATKKLLTNFVENRFKVKGIIVGADGKEVSGGEREIKPDDMEEGQTAKLTAVEYPNGVVARSGPEMDAEDSRSVDSRRYSLRALQDKSSSFFTEKFDKVLKKYGLSKGSIAKKNSRPPEDEEAKKKVVDEAKKTADGKVEKGLDKFSKGAGLVTGPITTGCTVYNTLRIVVGIVKAKWIADVVKFAFPFVQIASKIADGSATDADFDEIVGRADQLTWYQNDKYTDELAAKDPENAAKIRAKKNLTATDSQGLRMAMYGDTSKLLDFTKDYTTGGIGSIKTLGEGIEEFQSALGGKQNIREVCINAQRGQVVEGIAQGVACVLGSTLTFGLAAAVCVLKGAATSLILNAAQDAITSYIVERLVKALMSADLPSDLRGVDAGNALATGMGLMLGRTSWGYGLKPAKSADEVRDFISMTNDDYYKDYIEIAMDDAKRNPFDLYNEYSFASVLSASLNPYISGKKTGYSFATNAFTVITNAFNPKTSALHSQPSLMTNTEENLKHRLSINNNGEAVCPDSDKYDAKLVCDVMGRTVGITSKRVLGWLDQMANNDVTPLLETIDYMQQAGKYKDVGKTNEYDDSNKPEMGRVNQEYTPNKEGGTRDETCDDADNLFDQNCEDSEQPSIKEDGTVVENSQYDLYKKYCTEDRELDAGSSEVTLEEGSSKFQDWTTMKQCAKDSMMMDRFQLYMIICEGAYSMANGNICTSSPAVASVNGDACSLLNNPNIIYVNDGTKKGLKEICETGHSINSCGNTNYTLDQELMNIITTLSSKYKVWLNNFGFKYDRFSCDTGQHPKGKAVDLNGIEKLDGSGRAGGPDWGGITYSDPKQVKVIQDYASDWLAGIDHSHGGVGQKGCGGGRDSNPAFNPTFPAGSVNVNGAAFFEDSCDHLHIDVRDRGGPSVL